tara:strand:- start:118 stop:357 length:240 start_codon:yes stop_codon:yes gene_type:complete
MARELSIDEALRWHLAYNHYPPVNAVFVDCCKQAINFGKTEQWDRLIELPNGKLLTAAGVIDGLHLGEWLQEDVDGSVC